MARAGTSGSLRVAARRGTRSGIEMLARAGYFAKGAVFGTVGLLTAMTAFGFAGGRITGTRGAIAVISGQAFGKALLILIALGLGGFVVWRFVQAIKDPERHGTDPKGLVQRAGLLVSGVIYAGLALFTLRLVAGGGGGSGDDGTEQTAGWLMSNPAGIWLVGLVGAVVIGAALYQIYRVVTASYRRQWDLSGMSLRETIWATRISAVGIAARAVALALIGWFFIEAALQADPSEAEGLEGALQAFAGGDYGPLWLALIGVGFICYGVYCIVNGRYKRISP
jgi:hypothetical protein